MVPTRLVPFAFSSLMSWPGKFRMGMDLVLPRGKSGRRRVARRLRAPAPGQGDAGQGRRAHRRRHPRRRSRADERARDLPDVHGDGREAPQPHRRHGLAAQGARASARRRRAARAAAAGGAGAGGAAAGAGRRPAPRRPRAYFLSFATGLGDLSDAVVAALPPSACAPGGRRAIERSGARGHRRGASAAPGTQGYRLPCPTAPRRGRTRSCWRDAGVRQPVSCSATSRRRAAERPRLDPLREHGDRLTGVRGATDRRRASGLRLVIPRAEDRGIMATTFSSAKFAERAPDGALLLRAFVGRAGLEERPSCASGEMVQLVRARVEPHAGDRGRAEVRPHLPLAQGHAAVPCRPPRADRLGRARRSPPARASRSPAATSTASGSATASAREPLLRSAPSPTSGTWPSRRCPASRPTCRPATASKTTQRRTAAFAGPRSPALPGRSAAGAHPVEPLEKKIAQTKSAKIGVVISTVTIPQMAHVRCAVLNRLRRATASPPRVLGPLDPQVHRERQVDQHEPEDIEAERRAQAHHARPRDAVAEGPDPAEPEGAPVPSREARWQHALVTVAGLVGERPGGGGPEPYDAGGP